MNKSHAVRRIFHPTDFTKNSEAAFLHSLKLALCSGSSIHLLHVDAPNKGHSWERFPKVRETLARWNLLPYDAPKHDLAKLGIRIRKSIATGQDARKAMLDYVIRHHFDLMVLATHQREGLARVLKPSVSSHVSREARMATLFMPRGCKGFVSREDGSLSLKRILIPVDHLPDYRPTLERIFELVELLGCPSIEATLVHVIEKEGPMDLNPQPRDGWSWEVIQEEGPVVESIIRLAEARDADLIVMGTEGRHGLMESLRGSTTEQVVRETSSPVLAFNYET